jgi:hypothetical protein
MSQQSYTMLAKVEAIQKRQTTIGFEYFEIECTRF